MGKRTFVISNNIHILRKCQDQLPVRRMLAQAPYGRHHRRAPEVEAEEQVELVSERVPPQRPDRAGVRVARAVVVCGDSTQTTRPELRVAQFLFLGCLCYSSLVCSCCTSGESTTEPRDFEPATLTTLPKLPSELPPTKPLS